MCYFTSLESVAGKLECPLFGKVEMSGRSPHGTPISPDLSG
jgi:hypothetical protein